MYRQRKNFGCPLWRKMSLLGRRSTGANKYLNETVLHPSVRFGLAFDTYGCIRKTKRKECQLNVSSTEVNLICRDEWVINLETKSVLIWNIWGIAGGGWGGGGWVLINKKHRIDRLKFNHLSATLWLIIPQLFLSRYLQYPLSGVNTFLSIHVLFKTFTKNEMNSSNKGMTYSYAVFILPKREWI